MFDIKAVFISPTSVSLTWKNNDMAASTYNYRINVMGDSSQAITVNQTSASVTNLSLATSYTFSIIPEIDGSLGSATNLTVTTGKLTCPPGMFLNQPFSSCILQPCPCKLSVEEEQRFSVASSPGVQVVGSFSLKVQYNLGYCNQVRCWVLSIFCYYRSMLIVLLRLGSGDPNGNVVLMTL